MARTITVAGGNLFRVAAEQLGDARQWWRIAEANRLDDPMLTGVATLVLPVVGERAGDGLPPS